MSNISTYTPLSPSNNEIRLLTLRPDFPGSELNCRLNTVSLDSNPTYQALSYVWGTPPTLSHSLYIRGLPLRITKNLETALQHLRHPEEERVLWIDAVCINQSDIQERNNQVHKMGTIYTSASNVVIFLGKRDFEIDQAWNLLEKWNGGGREVSISEIEFRGLDKVFDKAEWWRRLWVVQEVIFSRSATLVCGNRSMDWDLMRVMCPRLLTPNSVVDRRLSQIFKHAMGLYIYRLTSKMPGQSELERFETYIESFVRTRTCTDKRDVIYSLLGFWDMNGEKGIIVMDYGLSVSEVYMQLTRRMMVFRVQLCTLCNTYLPYTEKDEEGREIVHPSWSIDWSQPREMESLINYFPPNNGVFYSAAGDTTIDEQIFHSNPNILQLTGVLFDSIVWRSTTNSHMDGWQETVRKWERPNLKERKYPTGEDCTNAYIRTIFRDVVRQSYGMPRGRMPAKHFPRFKQHYIDWSTDGDDSYFVAERLAETNTNDISRMEWTFALGSSTVQWCFFITKLGYFGMAPRAAKPGDMVAVVDGACTPLLFRKADTTTKETLASEIEYDMFTKVGAAYVHGIMDGEVMTGVKEGRLSKERILLI